MMILYEISRSKLRALSLGLGALGGLYLLSKGNTNSIDNDTLKHDLEIGKEIHKSFDNLEPELNKTKTTVKSLSNSIDKINYQIGPLKNKVVDKLNY